MQKYLIVGGADPLRQYKPRDLLRRNWIGNNSGNLLFLYGTANVLTSTQTECVCTFYKTNWSDAEIDEINQSYAAFVLPLADGFRADYIPTLRQYTKLIRKLTIPCIVNGIGLRAAYEPHLEEARPFDDDVQNFVRAVLDHSAKLGLRGAITGDYLSRLGFVPEQDFTVIGCPSMYMHGLLQKNETTPRYSLAVSLNGLMPSRMEQFYLRLLAAYPDAHIIQQRSPEIMDLYYGIARDLSANVPEFENHNIFESFDYSSFKVSDRVRFFLDVPSWIHNLKSFDLFVGARFHGTVAALLAGVPSILTPFDARTRELAEVHRIPSLPESALEQAAPPESLKAFADFDAVARMHEQNLAHYQDFLRTNGLYSAFDENIVLSFGNSPMEQMGLKSWRFPAPAASFASSNAIIRLQRSAEYDSVKVLKKARNALRHLIR